MLNTDIIYTNIYKGNKYYILGKDGKNINSECKYHDKTTGSRVISWTTY